ncbi:protein-lysine palmitoyltransferase [Cyanobacterium sp. Dongsha4]|uniref:protein-lysine palmitoyltransferase n=1 Tax=Cyanobacterium sp. DS4 TaxID=2878255 RepID=UPI002E81DC09|nr:protein-lysine palmitoyltransferase [Cyanobacterium sp. Dongsha4]WVK99704.1 toxin-activating lysine-acyltransferase [Cyanobacterium sp. Dongsha4]
MSICDIAINENIAKILGEIVFLMGSCDNSKKYPVSFIINYLLPSIHLNQYRIYRTVKENKPIGFVCWAFVNDQVEEQLIKNDINLTIEERKSGEILYILYFIAPFGHAKKITQDLKNNIFPHRIVKGLRLTKDSKKIAKIAIYHNRNKS